MRVPGMEAGHYSLSFLNGCERQNLTVVVHKGKIWQQYFILKDNCMIETTQASSLLQFSKLEVVERASDEAAVKQKHRVRVELEDCDLTRTHIHAIATTFVARDQQELAHKLWEARANDISQVQFHFSQWKNFFAGDRKLSDEMRYVLDRKDLEKQLGNSLERPTLLMKRNFVRSTKTDEQTLDQGSKDFGSRAEILPMTQNIMPVSSIQDVQAPHNRRAKKKCKSKRSAFGGAESFDSDEIIAVPEY